MGFPHTLHLSYVEALERAGDVIECTFGGQYSPVPQDAADTLRLSYAGNGAGRFDCGDCSRWHYVVRRDSLPR